MSESAVRLENVVHPLAPSVQEQVLSLWEKEKVKIEDKDERLREIVLLAWDGDELLGIASLGIYRHPGIEQSLFTLRALVRAESRQQGLSYQMYQAAVERVEERFDAGEDIRGIGVYVEVEAALIADLAEARCTFAHTHSVQARKVQFNLVGISKAGRPQYIYYFENASLFSDGPVLEEKMDKLAADADLELRFCWQALSPAEQQQIIGMWMSYGVVGDRESCMQRLPQVAAIALEEGEIVGISSVFQTTYDEAKATFLGFRSFVSPNAKSSFIATKLLNLVYDEFNKSYRDDNALQGIHGVAYVLQNDGLNKNVRMARGPDVGSCLIGYLDKLQLRTKYFDGASVKLGG
ncbi:hypothetical protein EY643_01560 [Halioglobus maricola]|uniref:Uncharacterized protein n=1 Tax=Halioglobus maricola TaxID=2601894 RepID=A0A5P9NGW1_9GAMM|nr:hypothetical protein [Halioglobus maricola]QFU74444.1 hypothetical protein EY643_01560 [Halioglobus maricola]